MESPSTDVNNLKNTPPRARKSAKVLRLRNEVALVIVALSLSGAMLVVPRPTYPQILPLPSIDNHQISSRERGEVLRALSVRDGSLDKETRAIGEMFRRAGLSLFRRDKIEGSELATFRKDVAHLLARKASDELPAGEEALLNLRALQGQLFLDAVDAWLKSGQPNIELKELGGPFVRVAEQSWLKDGELVFDKDELRLLFRVHWGKLTGLSDAPPFEPSPEELRRYYLSNLQHPIGPPLDRMTRTTNQIGFVRALGKIDDTYPTHLAEGILYMRLGQALLAMKSLRAHLDQHPDGPWTHLARNHLILATRQADAIAQAGR